MQPRQIGIVLVAVIAAFAVAFGIGKAAGGGGEPSTPAAAKATAGTKSLDLAPVKISSTVESGAAVPALRAAPKRKKPKPSTPDSAPTPQPDTPDSSATPAPTSVATPVPTAVTAPSPDGNRCIADCGGQGDSGGVGEG